MQEKKSVLILLISAICIPKSLQQTRLERSLVYPSPPGGVYQWIMGVGLPFLISDQSVVVGMIVKNSFRLPNNSTDYTNPGVVFERRKRSLSRWDIYEVLATITSQYGFGGKECVLQAICELADVPLDKSSTIIHEIIHALLTPSTTGEEITDPSHNEYHAAEQFGRKVKGRCDKFFRGCGVSLIDMYTKNGLNS